VSFEFCDFTFADAETYQKMLVLNNNSLVELCHLFLPDMKKRNVGCVINIASTGSFQPLPYQAVYGASKAFVLSFSEALSGELLESDIRVMVLCPRPTESNFMKNANADTSGMKLESARKVVQTGLEAFARNRFYVVSGKTNYLVSLIPWFVSCKKAVKIVAKIFKDRILGRPLTV